MKAWKLRFIWGQAKGRLSCLWGMRGPWLWMCSGSSEESLFKPRWNLWKVFLCAGGGAGCLESTTKVPLSKILNPPSGCKWIIQGCTLPLPIYSWDKQKKEAVGSQRRGCVHDTGLGEESSRALELLQMSCLEEEGVDQGCSSREERVWLTCRGVLTQLQHKYGQNQILFLLL